MVDSHLVEWVKNTRQKGFSDDELKKELSQKGHSPEVISEVFAATKPSRFSKKNYKRIVITLVVIGCILLIIFNSSFSVQYTHLNQTVQRSHSNEENYFREINFTEKFTDSFLDSVWPESENVVLGDRLHESSSYELYSFWYWANGEQDDPLGDSSDFIKIEIADFVSSVHAEELFDEKYELFQNGDGLLTNPTLIEPYSDIDNNIALYDSHYEQSNFYEGEYEIFYIFVENNLYVLVSAKFDSDENKEYKNELVVKIGEKVRSVIQES